MFLVLGVTSTVRRWRGSEDPAHRRHGAWLLAALSVMVVTALGADSLAYPWSDLAPAFGLTVVLARWWRR